MRKLLAVAVSSLVVSATLPAQGAISLEGLGFPPGQLSARAEGAGGSLGDFDPLSAVNPSALGSAGSPAVFFQYSPEFKRVDAGGGSAKTTTARFPVVMGILPMGQNWTMGLSSSTFLDRSYETNLVRRQLIGVDSFDLTERSRVLGAINDVRLALAWSRSAAVSLGLGAHVFAGSNRIAFSQIFPDSAIFLSNSQTQRVSYTGFAVSAGAEFRPSRVIGFAVSARKGGDLTAETGDTVIGRGRLPDHYSGSIIYQGITGASIAARVAHDSWSSMSSLSSSIQAFDGWDVGVGAEATGPRLLQRVLTVRLGARMRTLPFGLAGEKVSEKSFMGGIGVPLTRNRASFDLAVQRAARTSGSIDERGFILSFGLRVSP